MKYKNRVRSRISNLKDAKNPDLRRNVLCGTITPQQIAVMTSEVTPTRAGLPRICSPAAKHLPLQEMASDELKEIRKAMTKEAIREHQMARTGGTQTDLFTCGKCRKKSCTYTQVRGCQLYGRVLRAGPVRGVHTLTPGANGARAGRRPGSGGHLWGHPTCPGPLVPSKWRLWGWVLPAVDPKVGGPGPAQYRGPEDLLLEEGVLCSLEAAAGLHPGPWRSRCCGPRCRGLGKWSGGWEVGSLGRQHRSPTRAQG